MPKYQSLDVGERGNFRLKIVLLRPAPGRRTRSDGSSWANSFRPRSIVLGATPVAIATRCDPTITRGECLRRRDQTTAPSSRKGATAENRSLTGSISITPTIYGTQDLVVNQYITLSKVDSIIYERALNTDLRRRRAGRLVVDLKDETAFRLERPVRSDESASLLREIPSHCCRRGAADAARVTGSACVRAGKKSSAPCSYRR